MKWNDLSLINILCPYEKSRGSEPRSGPQRSNGSPFQAFLGFRDPRGLSLELDLAVVRVLHSVHTGPCLKVDWRMPEAGWGSQVSCGNVFRLLSASSHTTLHLLPWNTGGNDHMHTLSVLASNSSNRAFSLSPSSPPFSFGTRD